MLCFCVSFTGYVFSLAGCKLLNDNRSIVAGWKAPDAPVSVLGGILSPGHMYRRVGSPEYNADAMRHDATLLYSHPDHLYLKQLFMLWPLTLTATTDLPPIPMHILSLSLKIPATMLVSLETEKLIDLKELKPVLLQIRIVKSSYVLYQFSSQEN